MQGVDLVGLCEELEASRVVSLLEAIILEDIIRKEGSKDSIRAKLVSGFNKMRHGGTMDTEDLISDSDIENVAPRPDPRQTQVRTPAPPAGVKPMPRYTQPTDKGYPGLEAPVG